MMINISEFLITIFKKILKRPIISKNYKTKYHISRNSFSYYIRNNLPLSETLVEALEQIILDEISNNKEKEQKLTDYFKIFLTGDERNTTNTNEIIKIVLPKITTNSNKKHSKGKFRAVNVSELLDMGWSLDSYMSECSRMWDETMDYVMTDEHKGSIEQWIQIVREYPENSKILLNENNEMVGFWDFITLFKNDYERAKKGLLIDCELTLDIISPMISGTYNIYMASICLQENYKKTLALQKLLYSLLDTFEDLAENNIFINEICTWAYTDSSIALCKAIGLKYQTDHKEHGKIFCGNMLELLNQPLCSKYKILKTMYNKQFNM